MERLLYRLSKSKYQDQFILKGAMLFRIWDSDTHRPTRDVDFLGFGDSSESALKTVFTELCNFPNENDGLAFKAGSVKIEQIRDLSEYGGIRIKLYAELAGARIPVQADVGFGDAITPDPIEIQYPTLLDQPSPHLKTYPRETVIAEKFQALVNLGIANSRMKDFYDLYYIASNFSFEAQIISDAIKNTFSRRETPIPKQIPIGLTSEFYHNTHKVKQWNAFLNKSKLTVTARTLEDVCKLLEDFLVPVRQTINNDQVFSATWKPDHGWVVRKNE